MKRRQVFLLILAVGLTLGMVGVFCPDRAGAGSFDKEHEIKAAFIYKFIPYIQWPDGHFSAEKTGRPLVLGVFGENAFWDALMALESTAKNTYPVQFRKIKNGQDAVQCDVLVFNRMAGSRAEGMLKEVAGRPLLTIGEQEGFAESGGVINFFLQQDRVAFEINVKAAKRARLDISSRLLNLAHIVDE